MRRDEPTLSSDAARSLLLDAAAARAASALETAGAQPLLLRGPAVAARLYDTPAERPYNDVDVLIREDRLDAAGRALLAAGFTLADPGLAADGTPRHAAHWLGPHGEPLDLHRTIAGAEAPGAVVHAALHAEATTLDVGGRTLRVPSTAGLAFIVALHVAAHTAEGAAKPRADLDRAVARLPTATWGDVLALARRCEAIPALRIALEQLPPDDLAELRATLRADPTRPSRLVEMRARTTERAVERLDSLAALDTVGAKARFIARELAPAPHLMRFHWPLAQRGRAGLAAAYIVRLSWLARRIGPGVREWRRLRARSPEQPSPRDDGEGPDEP